jgi:hypothetical protein
VKQSPDEKRITERMAPGVLCRDGFLGTDRRPLREILETDEHAVAGLGTTHEAIAAKLQHAYDRARAGLGTSVDIGEGLAAVYREAMGRIPCPWGDGSFPKGVVELTAADGESMSFTVLSVHFIASHGFYQGRGSPFRLEPAELARLFALAEAP